MNFPIYLDNNSTTPMDPRVLEAMLPYFNEKFGNAASRNHSFGWSAEEAVDYSREQVARLIGSTSKEIIFTSGATEANNLAIKGVYEMYGSQGNHMITVTTEHKATLDACKKVENSCLDSLVITDSIEWRCPDECKKTIQLSTGALFGEAIRRITNEESVSSLFNTTLKNGVVNAGRPK